MEEPIAERLKDSTVRRSGANSFGAVRWRSDISLMHGGVRFRFSIKSGGQGETELVLTIGAKDFSAVLRAMTSADRQSAMKAMSDELQRQIGLQPRFDKAYSDNVRTQLKRKQARASTSRQRKV